MFTDFRRGRPKVSWGPTMFVTQSQGRVSMVNSRKLQKYVAYTIGLGNPRVAIHQHKNVENNIAFPIACKPSRW
jgi:hypothetical protein